MQAVSGRRRTKPASKKKSGDDTLLLVLGDALVTALWVWVSSLFAEAAETLSQISGITEFGLAVLVTVACIAALGPVCNAFGGAFFNPIHCAAFVVAGKGSAKLHAVRIAAQMLGALAGSYAAFRVTPQWLITEHFHKLPPGLAKGVALELGVAVELALGLAINLVVLHATDTSNKFVSQWSPLIATVVLIIAGSYFTGPSMNPAVAFSWHHHFQRSNLIEQALVYYVAPFAGALLGGIVYRLWKGGPAGAPRSLPAALKAQKLP